MKPEIRGLVIGLAAALVGLPLMGWAYFLSHMVPDGHTDFRPSYAAGYMLRMGMPLYDPAAQLEAQNRVVSQEEITLPFNHPAYEALVYVPLSFLSYLHAYCVWFALNLLILGLIYYVLRAELAPLATVAPWLPILSLAAFLPFGAALMQGQDSLLVVLLFSLVFVLLQDDTHLVLAGVLLGLAVFRFQLLVPTIACFLLWRRWKIIAGFLTTALPAAFVSIVIAGFWPYFRMLMRYSGKGTIELQRLVLRMPNLRGLIQSAGGGTWLIIIASLLLLTVAVLTGRGRGLQDQFSLAITVTSLVSYYGFVHDLSVLFIPCTLLLRSGNVRALSIVGIVFFAPTLLIFAPNHFYLAAFGVLALFAYLVFSISDLQKRDCSSGEIASSLLKHSPL